MIEKGPVSLEEMLTARDRRAARQRMLLEKFHAPLLYLTFNIPGPVKAPEGAEKALALACSRVDAALRQIDAPVLHRDIFEAKTGCEACFVVEADPLRIKDAMTMLEDADAFGRLLDLDVLTPEGTKLTRGTPRTCLLCGRPAHVCGRSRTHSLEELTARVEAVLREALA